MATVSLMKPNFQSCQVRLPKIPIFHPKTELSRKQANMIHEQQEKNSLIETVPEEPSIRLTRQRLKHTSSNIFKELRKLCVSN